MAILRPDFYDLSPVKRDKLLKEENRLKQIKLRQSLPVLSLHEIKKYRLPFHEGLRSDLIDAGFPNSAEFIKQLMEYQDQIREKNGIGSLVWSRPQLIHSRTVLDCLCKSLGKAEDLFNKGQHVLEWEELLKLAVDFAFGNDEWWWLGKQILFQCVSLEYEGRFEKLQAISYYLLGKFLLQNDRNPDGAIFWLDLSRELSEGKSWSAKKLLNDEKQDVIFLESCSLLYEALFEKAQEFMRSDPQKAIETCILARKRAAEGCRHDGEAQAYILKGQCELLLPDTTSAVISFIKALKIENKRGSIIGICEARIHLALAYLQHGKCDEALNNLEELKKFGEEHKLPYYIGQAYRYMGEYYLNGGNHSLATQLLTTAFYKFDQDENVTCREEVRTLAAISAGEELYPAYVELIVFSEEDKGSFLKLLKWKDNRYIFWLDALSDAPFSSKFSVRKDLLKSSDNQLQHDDLFEMHSQQKDEQQSECSRESTIEELNEAETEVEKVVELENVDEVNSITEAEKEENVQEQATVVQEDLQEEEVIEIHEEFQTLEVIGQPVEESNEIAAPPEPEPVDELVPIQE